MNIERTITDIPPDVVDEVIGDFVSEGCTAVKTKQPDGNFTVVATCPVGA
jgi:hypothetical protein